MTNTEVGKMCLQAGLPGCPSLVGHPCPTEGMKDSFP